MSAEQSPQAVECLPPLPRAWTVESTMKCTACGAPYEPMRALAPNAAAANLAWRVRPHACKCGCTQFGGTVSSENVSPAQYTAAQMHEYAQSAHAPAQATIDRLTRERDDAILSREVSEGVLRAEIARLRSRSLDVDAVMALADAYAEAKHISFMSNSDQHDEDEMAARAALRAALSGAAPKGGETR